MDISWKHPVMAMLLDGAAAWVNVRQPASAPAVNHTPVDLVVQTVQPFPNIVSENVFDLQKCDLAKEVQDQAARHATQSGNNAPVWHEANSDQAYCASIPGLEVGALIQRTGQKWRSFRSGAIIAWGGWLMVLMSLAILVSFLWCSMIPLKEAPTGRKIERLMPTERYVHWMIAISSVTLGVSGTVTLWGKHLLLPVLGYQLLG